MSQTSSRITDGSTSQFSKGGEDRRLPQRFLQPGELIVTHRHCEITTVLGPCVAVTMWHEDPRFAAICHAMMPSPHDFTLPPFDPAHPWKFATEVVAAMIQKVARQGLDPGSVEVKVFGGANLLMKSDRDDISKSIGSRNIATVLELLKETGFRVTASDVGGARGRKLIFNTKTGGVRVRTMNSKQPLSHPS